MTESIVAKRELGNGKWDKALKRKMVELSVADNYEDAKEEWIATGEVWWGQNDDIPDWVEDSQMGVGKCLCGHIVVYHFEIVNTENGVRECVGSDHINTYLIMRAIAEELQLPIDAITDEQIQEWINVRVKSMKAEAWWKENGTSFEMMFNAVKEMDLYFNTREDGYLYDSELRRTEPIRKMIKRGSGAFGSEDYQMASIVWRWNHPDNSRAQINTTGYPNDNLMKDLALFYVKSLSLQEEFANYQIERSNRKDWVIEQARLKQEREDLLRVQAEERRNRLRLQREEQERIYNLPENVEKRRVAAEKQKLENERIMAEQDKERKRKEKVSYDFLLNTDANFVNGCDNYGIPAFNGDFATNTWELKFLVDIKKRMSNRKALSPKQIRRLASIVKEGLPTDKQLSYLKDLGFEGTVKSRKEASIKISELKEMNE